LATPQATAVDIGALLDKQKLGGTTGPLAIGYVFSAKVLLYAVAGPYLIVMVLNFMLGRIYRRQFRTPVVAIAGE
jgi:hypothetical protein